MSGVQRLSLPRGSSHGVAACSGSRCLGVVFEDFEMDSALFGGVINGDTRLKNR